jgi:hypothetical protein
LLRSIFDGREAEGFTGLTGLLWDCLGSKPMRHAAQGLLEMGLWPDDEKDSPESDAHRAPTGSQPLPEISNEIEQRS